AAEDDLEVRLELSDPRPGDRPEVGRHELPVDRVPGPGVDAVAAVPGVAGDEELAGEQRPPFDTLKWMCGAGRPGYGTGLIVRNRYSPADAVVNRP
ncbi:MAG TPA: hypothetical protein VH092_04350, partial [Urbifossiella sp.]|nr:hypothetical protein [Urbifossiella sp.]